MDKEKTITINKLEWEAYIAFSRESTRLLKRCTDNSIVKDLMEEVEDHLLVGRYIERIEEP